VSILPNTPISLTGSETNLLRMLLEHVREHALFEVDAGGKISSWNGSIGRMFGHDAEDLRGADLGLLLPPDRRDPEAIPALLRRAAQTGRLQEQMTLRRKNGQVFQAMVVAMALPNTGHYGLVIRDLAVLLATHEQFHALATVDQITGLANRQHLFDLGRVEYRRWRRYKVPLSLVMVTLDQYKSFSDAQGHEVADGVLRDMADLMKQAVRDVDLVAHLEGAEFVALLPNTTQEGGAVLAERIRKFVNKTPFKLASGAQHLSASLAVLTATGTVVDFDDFIGQARAAVAQGQALGGDRIIVA
jgi:diguanylate cyclase (GGDEF)-like protein/PAS domain S-box-containing protein